MRCQLSSARIVAMIVLPVLLPLIAVGSPAPGFSQAWRIGGSAVIFLGYRASVSAVVPSEEMRLLAMVNRAREARRLAPLVMNRVLRKLARRHSRNMALDGYIGHDSPQGQSFFARLSAVLRGWRAAGENVAAASTVGEANREFMSSPSHLKNILDPEYRTVGIGIATAGAVGYMVTEDFAGYPGRRPAPRQGVERIRTP